MKLFVFLLNLIPYLTHNLPHLLHTNKLHAHTQMHTHAQIHVHTHHTHTCTNSRAHTPHTHMDTYAHTTHTHMHTHTHTHTPHSTQHVHPSTRHPKPQQSQVHSRHTCPGIRHDGLSKPTLCSWLTSCTTTLWYRRRKGSILRC